MASQSEELLIGAGAKKRKRKTDERHIPVLAEEGRGRCAWCHELKQRHVEKLTKTYAVARKHDEFHNLPKTP